MKKLHLLRKWESQDDSGFLHNRKLKSPETCQGSIQQLDGHLGHRNICSPGSDGSHLSSEDALPYTLSHTNQNHFQTYSTLSNVDEKIKNLHLSLSASDKIATRSPRSDGSPISSEKALPYAPSHTNSSQLQTYFTVANTDQQMNYSHMSRNASDVNIHSPGSDGSPFLSQKALPPLIPYHNNSGQSTSYFAKHNVNDIANFNMSPNTPPPYHQDETPIRFDDQCCPEIEILRKRPNLEIYRVNSNTSSADHDSLPEPNNASKEGRIDPFTSQTKSNKSRVSLDNIKRSSTNLNAGSCSNKRIKNQNHSTPNATEKKNGRPRKT